MVTNIRPGSKDVEPNNTICKRLFNGTRGKNRRDDDILTNKVHWWLNKQSGDIIMYKEG